MPWEVRSCRISINEDDSRVVWTIPSSFSYYNNTAATAPSTSSLTSECTTRISNTTTRRTQKNKTIFLLFVKILMTEIEEKDYDLFRKAQTVIRNCEQQKQRGEIESFVEGLYRPLKDTVGNHHWNEARVLLHSHKNKNSYNYNYDYSHNYNYNALELTRSSELIEIVPIIDNTSKFHSKNRLGVEESSLSLTMDSVGIVSKNTSNNHNHIENTSSNSDATKETKARKKRLWMIISIFMKYLERENTKLFLKARLLVNECVEEHRRYSSNCYNTSSYRRGSLSGSIHRILKNEIGMDHWQRAENYVAKALLKRGDHNNYGYKKNPDKHDKKRPKFVDE